MDLSRPWVACGREPARHGDPPRSGGRPGPEGWEKTRVRELGRLKAPELLRDAHLGAVVLDGARRTKREEKAEAAAYYDFVSTPLDKGSMRSAPRVSAR